MSTVSLDQLREREHRLLDHEDDPYIGLSPHTPVDRFMELNDGRVGEDSEELTVRENCTRKMLQHRPLPSHNPY